MKALFMAALIAVFTLTAPAEAAQVRSKSGATASVSDAARAKFQQLVDWLDAKGYRIRFMGGYGKRSGHYSKHPSGFALDINQTSRNRITASYPEGVDAYARSIGIIPGSSWCNRDTGHFQIGGYDGNNCVAGRHTHTKLAKAKGRAKHVKVAYAAPPRPEKD